jgi:hypothetical protein
MGTGIRVKEADTMPFERWTAYMWSILLSKGFKPKQRCIEK